MSLTCNFINKHNIEFCILIKITIFHLFAKIFGGGELRRREKIEENNLFLFLSQYSNQKNK